MAIEIPSCLTDEKARRYYIEIMEGFAKRNERAPKGVMGSYCLGGQLSYALEVALQVQNGGPKMTRVNSIEEMLTAISEIRKR